MFASEIMDEAAALLNDTAKAVFSYTVQIPYFNMAQAYLREQFELNNIPVTNETSAVITVEEGVTELTRDPGVLPIITDPEVAQPPLPYYPDDLIEIQQLWEQQEGQTYSFIPMSRIDFIPQYIQPVSNLIFWSWQDQKIKFVGATANIDVKIDYIKDILPKLEADADTTTSEIEVVNTSSFLAFKSAEFMAKYIMENPARSQVLAMEANEALQRTLGISNKGRQAITTRRRPFMAAYKSRGLQ